MVAKRKMNEIAVVDLGISNVKSVTKAIEYVGGQATLVSTKEEIKKARKIILPGVGSFDEAMSRMADGQDFMFASSYFGIQMNPAHS